MRHLLAAVVCLALTAPAVADEAKKEGENAQQNLMKVCNEKATGMRATSARSSCPPASRART